MENNQKDYNFFTPLGVEISKTTDLTKEQHTADRNSSTFFEPGASLMSDTSTNTDNIQLSETRKRKKKKSSRCSEDDSYEIMKLGAKIEELTKVIAGLEETIKSLQAENATLLDIIHKSKLDAIPPETDAMATDINISQDDWAAEVAENFSTALTDEVTTPPIVANVKVTQKKTEVKNQQHQPKKVEITNFQRQQNTSSANTTLKAPSSVNPTVSNTIKTTTTSKKDARLPPITVHGSSVKEIRDLLDHNLGRGKFLINMLRKEVVSVHIKGLDNFIKVKNVFQQKGYHFYTHTPKELLPYTLVINRLSDEFSFEAVRDFLVNESGVQMDFLGLRNIAASKWILKIGRNSDINGVYKIKDILGCKVNIRKNKKDVYVMCFRCQKPGHVSANCAMPEHCVKCSGPHKSADCPLASKEQELNGEVEKQPIKCVNCNVEGHTAGSRDCPKRIAYLEKIQKKKEEAAAKAQARSAHLAFVKENVSFAATLGASPQSQKPGIIHNLLSTNLTTPQSQKSDGVMDIFSTVSADCQKTFGENLSVVISRVVKFIPEYRQIRQKEGQNQATLGMIFAMSNING